MEHPKLRSLVDVIVCSVQGYRRLIDFLAGGEFRYGLVLASRPELSASGKVTMTVTGQPFIGIPKLSNLSETPTRNSLSNLQDWLLVSRQQMEMKRFRSS